MKSLVYFAAVAFGILADPVNAAFVTLNFSGSVHDVNGYPVPAPAGRISIGDQFLVSVTYDQSATMSPYANDDPSVAVYNGNVFWSVEFQNYKSKGQYSSQGIVVFNDYKACDACGTPYDSFGIPTMMLGQDTASSAFDMGAGKYYNSFGINLFDQSPDIWTSDALPTSLPLEKMKLGSVSFTFYHVDTQRLVGVWSYLHQGLKVTQSVSALPPPVPEAPTWLMMLTGFFVSGLAVRNGRRRVGLT